MSIWWSLQLRREAASVPLARRLFLGTMETAGVDPEISYDLCVALSEACANAVEHGGGGDAGHDGACQAYRVTAYLDGQKCRIEVADSGPGFPSPGESATGDRAHTELPAPLHQRAHPADVGPDAEHGRGLGLIQELADHVRIDSGPGRTGAVVRFDKMLKWREGAPLMAV